MGRRREEFGKSSKFPVILSQLRKERGISQKVAAGDLGISQALLSHYEKGIRECGLDFVIKCCEYYNVTSDYLLGRSEHRNGVDVKDENESANLVQSTQYLLDTANAYFSGTEGQNLVHDYFMLSLYRGALSLAKAGALPKELFRIDYTVARELASAAIAVQDAKFVLIEDQSRNELGEVTRNALNTLIEQSEEHIINNFILD